MHLMTVKQAAERLNVSKQLVYRLVQQGKLRAYKIASAIRIKEDDLDEYLKGCCWGPPVDTTKGNVKLRRLRI